MKSMQNVETKKGRKTLPKKDNLAFIENQIDYAISTFTDQFKLIVQVLTVLVVANVTILVYAISTKLAGMR